MPNTITREMLVLIQAYNRSNGVPTSVTHEASATVAELVHVYESDALVEIAGGSQYQIRLCELSIHVTSANGTGRYLGIGA